MGFAPIFVDCFALAVACIVFVVSLALIALFLLFVGFSWVVGGFLSLRMIATKKKGQAVGLVLSSWVVACVIRLLYV